MDDVASTSVMFWLSMASFVAAMVAAIYAIRGFWLKSGLEIRGSAGLMQSIASEDRYVHEVTLENMKDRAVVIFKIFLEVGHGYFIQLEYFEAEPLILRPFEAVRRKYDPLDHYSVGMRRIRMDALLGDPRVRRRLVLATSQGRYNVSRWVNRWDPISLYFKNHATGIVHPMRSTLNGRSFGSGTKYVLRLQSVGREDEVIPLYPRDYQVKRFRKFQLTFEALQSKEALETFLLERAIAGDLPCSNLEVFDLEEWRDEAYANQVLGAINAGPRGWFVYHVLGRAMTKVDNIRLWRVNREHRRRHREKLAAEVRGEDGAV